jgi:hypothetical protein
MILDSTGFVAAWKRNDCSHNVECSQTHLIYSLTDEEGHGVRQACFSHNVTEQSAAVDLDIDGKICLETDT